MEILFLAFWFSWSVWFVFFIKWLISYVKYKRKSDIRSMKQMINDVLKMIIMCIVQATIGLVIFFEFR